MFKKQEGLLVILLVLSILLLNPGSPTRAGSDSEAEKPLAGPDITLFGGPAPGEVEPDHLLFPSLGASPCKKVLFLDDRDGSTFSVLKGALAALGFEVQELLPSEITASLIAPYDVVVFSLGWYAGGGGQREITDGEAAALVQFVNSGKSLFLVGELGRASWSRNWRRSLNRIAGNFGISFRNDMLCSSGSHLSNPADPDGGVDLPIINDIRSNLLKEGVGSFSLFWGSGVGVKTPARAVARSNASSWRDTDCTWNFMISEWECQQDADQPSGQYPVLALAESGNGRILAIGDSSWMMNGWIDYTDNLSLAKNIFAWLARTPSVKSLTARPVQGIAPLQVTFTCKTKDAGTRVKEVRWHFGDGTEATTPTDNTIIQTNHRYTAGGAYAVTCTVVDTNDCSSPSSPVTVTVADNRPPVIDAFTSDTQTGIDSLLVRFTCSAHDPDKGGLIANYRFTFGDGSTTSSTSGQASNVYGVGSFNATCTAVDDRGAETTSSPLAITVLPNQHPVIDSFTANPQSAPVPQLVNFLCSAYDPDGSISNYRIDFGDGSRTTSTAGDAIKFYQVPGAFNATCTAVDNRGAETVSSPLAITVLPNQHPVIDSFTANPQSAPVPQLVNFLCSAYDPDGSISNYRIDFGDGSRTTSTAGDAIKFYQVPGAFNATCTAVDNRGAETTSSPLPIAIYEGPIITGYTAIEIAGVCDNTTLTRPYSFTCSASDSDGVIAQYEFEFGDNATETVPTSDPSVTVQHRYRYHEAGGNIHNTRCRVLDNHNIRTHSNVVEVQVHWCSKP